MFMLLILLAGNPQPEPIGYYQSAADCMKVAAVLTVDTVCVRRQEL